MSSNVSIISPSNMEFIRSVLGEAGYNAKLLVDDPRSFETAELLVTKLFLAGEDSRPGLAAKLECQFGQGWQVQTASRIVAGAVCNPRSSKRATIFISATTPGTIVPRFVGILDVVYCRCRTAQECAIRGFQFTKRSALYRVVLGDRLETTFRSTISRTAAPLIPSHPTQSSTF